MARKKKHGKKAWHGKAVKRNTTKTITQQRSKKEHGKG
jgi:hypothetical protein